MNIKGNKYKALHAGWLLACCSDKNVAKGEELCDSLPLRWQMVALDYKNECLEAYAKGDK